MSKHISRKRPWSKAERERHAWFRCHTKQRYTTWDGAERAARILMDDVRSGKVRDKKKGVLVAYPCKFSSEVGFEHFHIGHDKPPANVGGGARKRAKL